MDKENTMIKKNFVDLFCRMTKICKETNQDINKNYQRGRKDAFEEITQWFNNTYNNEKAISVNSLVMFLQDKIENTKSSLNSNTNDNEIKPIFDIGDIKIKKDYEDDDDSGFTNTIWPCYGKPELFLPNNKRKKN